MSSQRCLRSVKSDLRILPGCMWRVGQDQKTRHNPPHDAQVALSCNDEHPSHAWVKDREWGLRSKASDTKSK